MKAAAALSLVDPLLCLVFPSYCVVCHTLLAQPSSGPVCHACVGQLPRHGDALCSCGLPLPGTLHAPCGRCRRGLGPFEAGASLGPYEGSLRTVLHAFKYRSRRRLAGRIADVLLAEPAVRTLLSADAVLAPVPLHARRLRERGFNQSLLLARALGHRSGLPVCARALVRWRDTPAQTGLTAAERRRNVAGAFSVRCQQAVAARTIILVDDVMTTGATTRACAAALRSAGAAAVRVLTVARVV